MNPTKSDKRPLYARVYAELVERIRSGRWKPGQLIPNEFEIAAEFSVSQGTARKAIGALAAENLVVRRQGRGTFVFEHTPDDIMFRFFNLFEGHRRPHRPRQPKLEAYPRQGQPGRAQGAQTAEKCQCRWIGSHPYPQPQAVHHGIRRLCPRLPFRASANLAEIPDTFYDIFQKTYGVLVTRTDERLTAAAADAKAAREFGIAIGTPLIKIDRVAFTLDDRPVEWRTSLCHLKRAHYLARTR